MNFSSWQRSLESPRSRKVQPGPDKEGLWPFLHRHVAFPVLHYADVRVNRLRPVNGVRSAVILNSEIAFDRSLRRKLGRQQLCTRQYTPGVGWRFSWTAYCFDLIGGSRPISGSQAEEDLDRLSLLVTRMRNIAVDEVMGHYQSTRSIPNGVRF